jgi:cysteine synthase
LHTPHAAVTDEEAFQAARLLACREGILAGVSSRAALLADSGERYISSALFDAAANR